MVLHHIEEEAGSSFCQVVLHFFLVFVFLLNVVVLSNHKEYVM